MTENSKALRQILAADVVGFSRLTQGADEDRTLARLRTGLRKAI